MISVVPSSLDKIMATHDIYNYRKVNDHLVTGGQPTEAQLRDAAAEGFEAVVNLAARAGVRPHPRCWP